MNAQLIEEIFRAGFIAAEKYAHDQLVEEGITDYEYHFIEDSFYYDTLAECIEKVKSLGDKTNEQDTGIL